MGFSSNAFFFLLGTLFLLQEVEAQDRYAIHFKYKPTEIHSLERPFELMTAEALARREREAISVDSTDLPVSPKYIADIELFVRKILYHTHWLNASVVVAEEASIAEIRSLPFVSEVVLVGRGSGPKTAESGKKAASDPFRLRIQKKQSQPYDFQNELLGIPQMHLEGYTGTGVRIAVFDAGFQNVDVIPAFKHLFDEGKIIGTRDFVIPGSSEVFKDDTHGTGALSLIASNHERLLAGAYDASFILCITEDVASEFRIEEYNWVKAAEYADSLGVDIINSSLGYNQFDDVDMNYGKDDMDGNTATISIGASIAAQKGILVVTSNGNEGNLSWRTITAPADAADVLAVGAISNSLEKASFSSVGPTADGRVKPDLVAYGTGVSLWRYVSGPSFSSGTSFSAPQIAALAAGLWQANPTLRMVEIKEKLLLSGHLSDDPNMELGYGIPNFERAMYGIELENEEILAKRKISLYPNPLDGDRLFAKNVPTSTCCVRLMSSSGNLVNQWILASNEAQRPMEFDIGNVMPGFYIVEFQSTNWSERFKLLKR
ncbi:MAG: S8 family serine peptidase [Lunatimonas sp.]|uniref:S8 family serine peptidase n=1 Tax=Lunatimonas sp. TaxID=2060141 RepID=UPI00263A621C|nr:S8 family serine peptidase [Lunatimonas sp.]MCC5936673.1 S8 family serine peptidase [Lunatimonas sp.]